MIYTCDNCGVEFDRYPSRAERYINKFCSKDCSKEYQEKNTLRLEDVTPELFKTFIDVDSDGCWVWRQSKQELRGGYGQKRIDGKLYKAHRLSWLVHHGEIPEGLFVCHMCDYPPCCNPDHLFLGTPKDNTVDAWEKGRLPLPTNVPVGEDSKHAKLTEAQVLEIRKRYDSGEGPVALAREFAVSRHSIWNVGARKTWKHLK